MFKFFKTEEQTNKAEKLNEIYSKLKEYTYYYDLPDSRKKQLQDIVKKYGYLNYPHLKVLEELSAAETLCALEIKWENNGIFKNGEFIFENDKISPLARNGIKNSDWIKKEGHDIKLINLAGLGNGNYAETPGKFFDWVKQILVLPTGDKKRNIFNTTIYLTPFQTRDFGCAYLPTESNVSPELNDENIEKFFGFNVKKQVQLFIEMAQLAGHPVIYDVLPQAGRFEKIILTNPYLARWYDINDLINKISTKVDEAATLLEKDFDKTDIKVTKDLYKQILKGGAGEITTKYLKIYEALDKQLENYKREISFKASEKSNQNKLAKRVQEIIVKSLNVKTSTKLCENDIKSEVINSLTNAGLWTVPGGAWCSAGVPAFQKMSDCGVYPIFKHYDYEGNDVTSMANLDCQTPYYFTYLENGTINKPVVNKFIEHLENFQRDYGFDGFRVDHVDHIVDNISTKNGKPISYRIPYKVLDELNLQIKKRVPYFATLAEYMLWENFYKEYHEDMHFDILWGNDIVSQASKTPENIVIDNQNLTNYNVDLASKDYLSILKTYNNQDGEFEAIDQYPAQLGENGAIFKWFKYKFLPGGKFANRPVMYVDGDETFTQNQIEKIVGNEISMKRNKNYHFFNRFDSINRLAKSFDAVTEGEAQIIIQEDDGYACWLISKETLKTALLIVANYKPTTEKIVKKDNNQNEYKEIIYGQDIFDKKVCLPGDYSAIAEYVFNGEDFERISFSNNEQELFFDKLYPSQFKIFELTR